MSLRAIPEEVPQARKSPGPGGVAVAIIAAVDREVRPLVRNWPAKIQEHEGWKFEVFESQNSVVICGGIGAEAARRGTEAVIATYHPEKIISVGFAGALTVSFKAGDILIARQVIDVADGNRFETGSGEGSGEGRLVSFSSVADREQKARLAKAYDAQGVDMEAAAVARCAQIHGVEFLAVKAISDEADATLPNMSKFIERAQIRTGRFLMFAVVRPWLWPGLLRLARNSAKASRALCQALHFYVGKA